MYVCYYGQNLAIGSEDKELTKLFHRNITMLLTLKVKSVPLKCYHSFWLSQWSICASLVKLIIKSDDKKQHQSQWGIYQKQYAIYTLTLCMLGNNVQTGYIITQHAKSYC